MNIYMVTTTDNAPAAGTVTCAIVTAGNMSELAKLLADNGIKPATVDIDVIGMAVNQYAEGQPAILCTVRSPKGGKGG